MTDPIQPVHLYYGVGNNPFLLERLAHLAAPEAQSVASKENIEGLQPLVIDDERIKTDRQYFLSMLDWILARARLYFKQYFYQAAEQEYKLFIRYMHMYGDRFNIMADNYYLVMFEYSWLQLELGHQREAQQFLNQELLILMEAMLNRVGAETPETLNTRQMILGYQETGLLPTHQQMRLDVSDEILSRLSKQLISIGQRDLARQVLGQLEIRQLLTLFQTEQLAQKLAKEESHGLIPHPQPMLPLHYSHWGLPYSPFSPVSPEDTKRFLSQELKMQPLTADRVEPVYGLNRDPNEREKREQRQRRKYQSWRSSFIPKSPFPPLK